MPRRAYFRRLRCPQSPPDPPFPHARHPFPRFICAARASSREPKKLLAASALETAGLQRRGAASLKPVAAAQEAFRCGRRGPCSQSGSRRRVHLHRPAAVPRLARHVRPRRPGAASPRHRRPHQCPRDLLLPTGLRHRRHPALHPAGVRGGEHLVEQHHPRCHRCRQGSQDAVHLHGHLPLRPPRLLAAPHQRAGITALLTALGTTLLCTGVVVTTAGEAACVAFVVASVMAFSIGLGPLALSYGMEILPPLLRAGHEPRHRGEPAHVRHAEHDLHLPRQHHQNAWVFVYVQLPEMKGRNF
ncbi:hypothetical protein PVAP13_6NG208700 [Panicum virgatum]|uniref:Uncharacterized protein n=1 Tax=Panicum virgatum TaxID=38727 RepID=A0A8T0QZ52_PANVG|nr:hypothetical protein PVAP13_6NG208700 [Panicum virgatum]